LFTNAVRTRFYPAKEIARRKKKKTPSEHRDRARIQNIAGIESLKEQDTTQYNKLPVNSVSPRFAKEDDTPKQGDSGSEEEIDLKSTPDQGSALHPPSYQARKGDMNSEKRERFQKHPRPKVCHI
jgi:hypothetical protein